MLGLVTSLRMCVLNVLSYGVCSDVGLLCIAEQGKRKSRVPVNLQTHIKLRFVILVLLRGVKKIFLHSRVLDSVGHEF